MEDKVLSKVVLSGTIKEWVGKMKFCFVPGGAAVKASPELGAGSSHSVLVLVFGAASTVLSLCLSCEIINLLNASVASIQIKQINTTSLSA